MRSRIRRPGKRGNADPGLVSEPVKEAPLTETNSLTTCPPVAPADCPGCAALREENRLICEARVFEDEPLRARARLLREAIREREPYGVVAWNAVELVELLKGKGLA